MTSSEYILHLVQAQSLNFSQQVRVQYSCAKEVVLLLEMESRTPKKCVSEGHKRYQSC